MLERVLAPVWIMLFAGMLLIDSAVRLGALDRLPEGANGWRKAAKAVGVGMLLLGAMEFVGVASGARDYLRPLEGLRAGSTGTTAVAAPFRHLTNAAELDAAIAAASVEGKPVLFDFYADWCVECKRMEKYVFTDAAVREALDGFVLLKIDVTDQTDDDVALQQRFGIIGPPATLFFSCHGDERRPLRLVGYEHAEAFVERLRQATSC
jgi:thiol:disulfide interchange protein DsbD